jgi:hypothetical protein
MLQILTAAAAPPNAAIAGSLTRTCQQLREWTRAAQPNARLPYASGIHWQISVPPEQQFLVLRLQGLGLVTSHFVRGPVRGGEHYVLQRTQRPYVKGMQL